MRCDKRASVRDALQFVEGADPARRPSPNGVHHGVQQLSTDRRGEPSLREFPFLRAEASGGERLERALRLHCKNLGTAANRMCGASLRRVVPFSFPIKRLKWNSTVILYADREWQRRGGRGAKPP